MNNNTTILKLLLALYLIFGFFNLADAKSKKKKVAISIEKGSRYNDEFVKRVHNSELEKQFKSIYYKDSIIILDKIDTIYFPIRPEIGRFYILKSKNKMWISELVVERKDLTSIEYMVAFTDRLGYRIEEKGIATLNPTFVLGDETDEIDGDAYLVDEYIEKLGNRYISIRLGVKSITDTTLLGRVYIEGIDRCSIIELDELPVYKEDIE